MPSAAQMAGADMIKALLPADASPPRVTILSRDMGNGRGIAFTFWWPDWHGMRGEYRATIVVPHAFGILRTAAETRLAQLVARHAQIERVQRTYDAERAACDGDPEADDIVDDDMPTPAWRMHVPLALRRALDETGLNERAKMDLVERQGGITWRGATIGIDDREDEDGPLLRALHHPEVAGATRWVRRATISSSKATWTQGIKKSQLKVHMPIPDTLLTALVGRSPSQIIDLPGMDAPGLLVSKAKATKTGCEFEITRAFTMLGDIPGDKP